ncbi:HEPN-associated N-terminal domain-containing protein [Streptomyces phaeochromogenes]|uniref:HEPN-associated N-terminal domain-containing protein n=1 Tax=Streptomyces phaeochromogenes TaxID=1923 RepID=UPI0027D8F2AA|nr:HEPN-associated N-terminal domain-containing protein [Streptomyces phaeochromogenes]
MDDDALADVLRTAADSDETCDFCQGAPAADLDVLLTAFFDGLRTEYATASDEGAYFEGELAAVRSWDGPELVDEYIDVLRGEKLQETVRNAAAADEIWVERDFVAVRHDDALREGWERFCTQVMYRTRYVFWLTRNVPDEDFLGAGEIPAAAILDTLGELIPEVGLIRELPAGHRLWRARTHTTVGECSQARDLGTALPEQAVQPNRMSPAGIPLFYGASSPRTAAQEVTRHATDATTLLTYAAFETTRSSIVVDFTQLPPVPSMFDPERAHLRRAMTFLHEFVARLSAVSNGREHLEYVPTQIVTEYLLRVFRQDRPVDGLLFTSSADKSAGGGTCTVLDVPQLHCLDSDQPEPDDRLGLRLVPETFRADQPLLRPR